LSRWLDRMTPHMIFCVTTCLVLFGLVMVYSSSAFDDYKKSSRDKLEEAVRLAVEQATLSAGASDAGREATEILERLRQEDAARRASMLSTFFRQARWVFVGFLFLAIAARLDYPLWGKKVGWLLAFFLVSQIMLFVIPADTGFPVQSRVVNGARSWIQVSFIRYQPSEVAKLGLVIFAAWFLARRLQCGRKSLVSLLPALIVTGTSIGLILLESDKGVAAHLCLALLVLWMLAGVRFSHIALAASVVALALGILIASSPEALSRVFEDSFQLKVARAALSRGGLFGAGLGDGDADLAYLYAAHTDFILAVVGEELGFLATTLLVAGYLVLILLGLKVVSGCSDPFGMFLALGITILLGSQAFLNMAVVTGLAPTTGFTLPLLSYGGSSLVWTMAGIGILVNVSLSTPHRLLENAKRGTTSLSHRGGVA